MTHRYTLSDVATIVDGTLIGDGHFSIEHLELDSRTISFPETALFFGIKGPQHDGHRFIPECYKRGVRAFVVEAEIDTRTYADAGFVKVVSSVEALQMFAAHHRSRFNIPVIGITGSNGKTIVKEWLSQMLTPELSIAKSPKSYNSQTGVPLSVWRMDAHHQLGIFEAGISQPGEMEKLEPIIRPTVGIFTNIGPAHDAGFNDQHHKITEKLKLFTHTRTLIYCRDHEAVDKAIKNSFKGKTFTWSLQGDADLRVEATQRDSRTEIVGRTKTHRLNLTLPFTDDASIENALHCLAAMLCLDVDVQDFLPRFAQLRNLPLRLEMKKGIGNSTIIYDCYNADLDSLLLALDFMAKHDATGNRTVILSDILQSGRSKQELYREASRLLALKNVTDMIGIGDDISSCKTLFSPESKFYSSTEEFIQQHPASAFANNTVLLKGARKFQFERIGQFLERKAHQTVLEIDLNALAHNLSMYRGMLKSDVKVMVMVKALSYGAGSYEIAQLLQFHQVDYLAVAYTDEGVELRQSGIRLPIMVMNATSADIDLLKRCDLEPEVYSLSFLQEYLSTTPSGKSHLKLETGMHRLGFDSDELSKALDLLRQYSDARVQSVFSHLAASDDPKHDDFTKAQLDRFRKMSDEIIHVLGYQPVRHILNSSGIARFPDDQYDMVRLGIGLYGIDTSRRIADKLRPISILKTIVSQVKNLKPGEAVGYDVGFVAKYEMRIATIGIGYADGFRRSLGHGKGRVIIRGKVVPTVGNICMDMTMVDVTSVPECSIADEVEIFGRLIPVTQVAEWADTSAYEIISTVSSRVKRVYLEE